MIKRITEADTDMVTLSTATADVETEVIDITVPDAYRFILRTNTVLDLTLQKADATELTDSADIKIYIAPPDKLDKKAIARFPYRQIKNASPYNVNTAMYLLLDTNYNVPEKWHVLFTVKDSNAASSTKTKLQLDCEKLLA